MSAEDIVRAIAALSVRRVIHDYTRCTFCDGPTSEALIPAEHDETCLWRQAVEWVADNPERTVSGGTGTVHPEWLIFGSEHQGRKVVWASNAVEEIQISQIIKRGEARVDDYFTIKTEDRAVGHRIEGTLKRYSYARGESYAEGLSTLGEHWQSELAEAAGEAVEQAK